MLKSSNLKKSLVRKVLVGLALSILASIFTGVAAQAAGLNYTVGQTGPGGGKVFYTSVTAFSVPGAPCGSNCHYLEYAPSSWAADELKNEKFLYVDAAVYYGGGTGTALGTGYNNTILLATDNPSISYVTNVNDLPRRVRAYRGGGQSDWFIPSVGEWYLMSASTAYSLGSFNASAGFYWTSTATNTGPGNSIQLHDPTKANGSSDPGLQPAYRNSFPVRPIRAFGDPLSVSGAPTSVVATATGATTANVSFTAPASDGGATISSYTATSSPGGITGTITQAGSGTIAITGLSTNTTYTFTIKATNSIGESSASSASNSITTISTPTAPTSVVATATGKRSATVEFAAPSSNGGSVVTSYSATSTPGGNTKSLTQSGSGTFTFDGLQPGTTYTFAVTATNANGVSASATSNSIKTTAADSASLTSISFTDDGTGTGGKLTWVGSKIDSVLYTGPADSYPGSFTFGAFTSSWNGNIRNLVPDTSYNVSIYAISTDGIGESKSLTFKTGPKKDVIKDLSYWNSWLTANANFNGESARLSGLLTKFNSLETSPYRSYIKVPISRTATVTATSLTPASCSVISTTAKVDAGMVKALSKDTCTISYTVTGPSKAPATLVKDFVFKKIK